MCNCRETNTVCRFRINILMMHDLVMVPGWYHAFTWIPTWNVVHLIEEKYWVHALDTQSLDDTISWAKLSIGSTYILGRWRCTCQVSFYLFRFLKSCKATGSDLFRSCILIWRVVSVLLLAIGVPWSSFPLFHFGSGFWLCSRILFSLVCLLPWWSRFLKIVHYQRDNVWSSTLVFNCMRQNLALLLVSLLMLVCSVDIHKWEGWSVQHKILQLYIAAWSVCPWVGLGTL